ncbi:conserved hypothetical protein [Hyphomicrobiales bacterium]|nr:conserved hypothetical protein [Hyphomicrobiales bacterium]CAH1699928.1 conserved hypothetical protein [Hyphomicrobiales bacterium]CAI0343687.1 conserved hypothetical protein [Hyphomicrobiales bacterium]
MPALTSRATIELRLSDGAQLFNTLDPFPFREGDIAAEADEYIVDWARDLPKDAPIAIVVHLENPDGSSRQTPDLPIAIRNWFSGRAEAETKALRELFRDGRLAFAIGFAGLAACLFFSWLLTQAYEGPFARVFQESLIIIGWVVIWRPAEMFLYDWVPILRRRKLYRRLAEAKVEVRYSGS